MWRPYVIGSKWRNLSVFKKTMLSFILIFCINILLLLVWRSYANKKEGINTYQLSIVESQKLLNECIISSNNFLIVDVKDTSLYKNESSVNIKEFEIGVNSLKSKVQQISNEDLSDDFKIQDIFDSITYGIDNITDRFEVVTQKVITKGFYDYGLEGLLRNEIHEIENNYTDQIGLNHILELRRIEKDYLLRGQLVYLEKFKSKIHDVVQLIDNGDSIKNKLVQYHLLNYADIFTQLVLVDKEINHPISGLKKQFNAQSNALMLQFDLMSQRINEESANKMFSLQVLYWSITAVFVLFSFMLIYFISRELTIPLLRLNTGIKDFVESEFTVKSYPVYKDRKDELGVLSSNFFSLQSEIADTFSNYRTEAEQRQQKLVRQNEKIEIQKFLISEHRGILHEKNLRLEESLNYALKIQTNLMADAKELAKTNLGIVSWYQPKDIVSGDFYWYFENENYYFVCLADCTGHGVPGAFLSILGISFLNSAVRENEINEPNEILEYVNNKVVNTFNSDTQMLGLRDSIDMVMVRIDKKKPEVVVSSANKDYLIGKNGELERIKTSRCSVGSSLLYNVKVDIYENIVIDSSSLDGIYLYSDGIIDQFGDKSNKKFKFKRLEQEIIIADNAEEVVRNVKKSVMQWKGSMDQTDDISFIAIDMKKFNKKLATSELELFQEMKIA